MDHRFRERLARFDHAAGTVVMALPRGGAAMALAVAAGFYLPLDRGRDRTQGSRPPRLLGIVYLVIAAGERFDDFQQVTDDGSRMLLVQTESERRGKVTQ